MIAQERDRLLSMGLNLPITHPIFNLDMSIFEDPEVDTVLLPYVKQVVEAVERNDFEKLEDLSTFILYHDLAFFYGFLLLLPLFLLSLSCLSKY